jgi:hypothetical protein
MKAGVEPNLEKAVSIKCRPNSSDQQSLILITVCFVTVLEDRLKHLHLIGRGHILRNNLSQENSGNSAL